MSNSASAPGGFLPQSLPSPASTSASPARVRLPHPRSQPLRPGSQKEETTRQYIDSKLLQISRRYVKKFSPVDSNQASSRYTNFREVAKDLGEVIDVLWASGTPTLQIPYLFNIALAITNYLPAFPPAPSETFHLLHKMDHAFASLLQGTDIETGEILPGFLHGRKDGMNRTDMVRCKSLIETTRVLVVEVMARTDVAEEDQVTEETDAETTTDKESETEDQGQDIGNAWDLEDDDEYDMDVARVYEKTLVQLGHQLGEGTNFEAAVG